MTKAKMKWLGLLAGLLCVGVFYYYWVQAPLVKTRKNHSDVKRAVDDVNSLARQAQSSDIPSQGDIDSFTKYKREIEEELGKATEKFKQLSELLNTPLPPSLDSPTNFATMIRDLYETSFKKAESILSDKMAPRLAKMAADIEWARNPYITDSARANLIEKLLPEMQKKALWYAHIWHPNELTPVRQTDSFSGKPQIRVEAWRVYKLFDDILTRVIPSIEVPVKRKLFVFERRDESSPPRRDALQLLLTCKEEEVESWRYIQAVRGLRVEALEYGNAELGSDSKTVPLIISNQPPRYYDLYRLEIRLFAHISVIQEFLKTLQESSNIYYEPVSMTYELHSGTASRQATVIDLSKRPPIKEPKDIYMQSQTVINDIFINIEDEPAVEAAIKINVYRFRFAGQVNPTAPAN